MKANKTSCLNFKGNELFIEQVKLKTIAQEFGTPCYVYSRATLTANWHNFEKAFSGFKHRICYAVKANSNIALLNLFASMGAGFDIVSVGELERVMAAGADPKKTIFSGVGKKQNEIEHAIERGIYCFNVESEPELARINTIAARFGTTVNVALRVNPNIHPKTHSHIVTGLNDNKFGIDVKEIIPLCQKIQSLSSLKLIGLASHIGSQITELSPFLRNVDCLLKLYQQLASHDIHLHQIDVGGGLGITYQHEQPPAITEYANALAEKIKGLPLEIIVEPGRALIGNAGVLLTQVEYLKHTHHKNFVIVDAGMNDMLRPALYDAWQDILPVELHAFEKKPYDIAGPLCESADILGKDRDLAVSPGDFLAIDSAGAYGFSMSSNYNSRCRAAEVLVDGDHMQLIRRRETFADLIALESLESDTITQA